MNCLSLALNKAAQEGRFKYHSKCQKTRLTHLCFADDLLIFTDGSLQSVAAILEVLKDFESRSGLAVSIQKTCHFSAGLKDHDLDQIKVATNLTTGTLPVRYLGVPLCTKKLTILQCAPLIQSIKSRLHSWTTKSSSYAGRLQLLSSVIAGITNFWSSSIILPKGCIAEINSLCSKFLCNSKQRRRRIGIEGLIFLEYGMCLKADMVALFSIKTRYGLHGISPKSWIATSTTFGSLILSRNTHGWLTN